MGMIAKAQTKKRVAPVSADLHSDLIGPPSDWRSGAGLRVDELVRSVAFLHNMHDYSSNTGRGRQGIVARAIASRGSRLWLDTSDYREWTFVLGTPTLETIAIDWAIAIRLNGNTATVVTTKWLATDGALANAKLHDEIRHELLEALTQNEPGRAAREDGYSGEVGVGLASLTAAQTFTSDVPEPFALDFSFTTTLDRPAVVGVLENDGFRQVGSIDHLTWGLGMPEPMETDRVTLTPTAGRIDGHASVHSPSPVSRRLAMQTLKAFIDRTLFLLRTEDKDALYHGPDGWLQS